MPENLDEMIRLFHRNVSLKTIAETMRYKPLQAAYLLLQYVKEHPAMTYPHGFNTEIAHDIFSKAVTEIVYPVGYNTVLIQREEFMPMSVELSLETEEIQNPTQEKMFMQTAAHNFRTHIYGTEPDPITKLKRKDHRVGVQELLNMFVFNVKATYDKTTIIFKSEKKVITPRVNEFLTAYEQILRALK